MGELIPETKRFILTEDKNVIDQELNSDDVKWWKKEFKLKKKRNVPLFQIRKSSDSIFNLIEEGDLVHYYDKLEPPTFIVAVDFLKNENQTKIGVRDIYRKKACFFEDILALYKPMKKSFKIYFESFLLEQEEIS